MTKILITVLMFCLAACLPEPPSETGVKQGKLVGFQLHNGYTTVCFVLRSKCNCDTVLVNYMWENTSDLNHYTQNEKYTIIYQGIFPVSFRKNL